MSVWFLVLVALELGCDGHDTTADAAADATADADVGTRPMVTAPAAPTLPSLAPCFDGFRELESPDGVTLCDPWPDTGPESCTGAEAHFPGGTGCERVGTACAASGFAEGLPTTGVIHARPGATSGDGSAAAPFGLIEEALAAASDGDTIALGVGTFAEEIVLDRPIRLVGACASGTVVTSTTRSAAAGVLTVRSAGVTIENLSVADSARSGIWIEGETANATIRDVRIEDVVMLGLDVERGATVDASRVVMRDVALADVAPFTGFLGRGINVESGSTVTLDSVTIEGAREFGLLSFMEGSSVSAMRVDIRAMRPRADGTAGIGVMVLGGASLEGRGIVVDGASEFGVAAEGVGSELTLEDAFVTGTLAGGSEAGRAFNLQEGPSGSCSRCRLEESAQEHVLVGAASTATLTDLVLAGMGRGIELQRGAELSLTRAFVADIDELALLVDSSSATIDDLTVKRVAPVGAGILGRAVTIQNGSSLVLSRAHFEDIADSGLFAHRSDAEVRDLRVQTVAPWASGRYGRGLEVQRGSTLRGERIAISDTFDLGMLALLDAEATVTDLQVSRNQTAACAATTCPSLPGGHGLGIYASTVDVDGLRLDQHDVCGIHVASDGVASIRNGVVSNNAIGACIQSTTQSLDALQDGVVYVDNGINLESTTLPVPEPGDAL